jgi:hypothetical protein
VRLHNVATATAIALSSVGSLAAIDCPPAVTAAVQKAHADAAIASCKQDQENKTRFKVKLAATTGKGMELDVTSGGTIVSTEQDLAVSDVPPAVMTAFAAKFGAVKPTRATMQTAAHGKITYELAFVDGIRKKEATFTSA